MSESTPPPESPASAIHATAHAYASNGLEILQAASDAALAVQHSQAALQNAASQAVEAAADTDADTATALSGAALSAVLSQQHLQHHQQQNQQQDQHAPQHHDYHDLQQSQLHDQQQLELANQGGLPLRGDQPGNPKLTRLRRACDMCSMRKVKCDDANIPCRPCRELNVDCTFHRETKRRGPPNKHAEAAKAAKRVRTDDGMDVDDGRYPSPLPVDVLQSNNHHGGAPSMSNQPEIVLVAESIAPMPVLELLIDDFYTYIHPLMSFPHEPTFRRAFDYREDRTNPEFLGLLASMICGLVAAFPRSVREHLKSQHSTHLFPRASILIDKCLDLVLLTRGPKWAMKQPKTLNDVMTSYFISLATGYTHQWDLVRHFMAETLSLLRGLGFHRPKQAGELPAFGHNPSHPDSGEFNHIQDQMGKRVFWNLFLGSR